MITEAFADRALHQEEAMTRMLTRSRALAVAACLTIAAAPRLAAQDSTKQQGAPISVSAKALCDQLGVRLQPKDDDELRLGASVTATLKDPEKLAAFGVKGMHAGARVIIARVAPDKVRVEADEMEPAPANAAATIKLDAKGVLVAPGGG
jgi:hypothetical protein